MKIFGINFGRKKKLRPKKQKKIEPAIPQLTYSPSFFEDKVENKKTDEKIEDSNQLQEITLPEKSQIDLDDNSQIGFVPEPDIIQPKEEILYGDNISQQIKDELSVNTNEQNEWLNNYQDPAQDYSENLTTGKEELVSEFSNYLSYKLQEKTALLEEIDSLNSKIEGLKLQAEDLNKIIEEKQETIDKLQNEINSFNNEININIEEKRNLLTKLDDEIESKSEELKNLIEEKYSELNSILKEIEQKSLELKELEEKNNTYLTITENELNEKIEKLKLESEELEKLVFQKNEELNQLDTKLSELTAELEIKIEAKRTELKNIEDEIKLKQEESKKVDEKNANLIIQTEKQLKDKIFELHAVIESKTAEISKLDSELITLSENFEKKKSEFQNWEEENKINQETILKSKDEIAELEKRVIEIHAEAKELLNTKNEIYSEILKLQEELTELKSEKEKTIELIQLSQKRRDEIEFSNDQLEKRLLRMIQKFDDEIKELSTHKSNIEKKISELENKVVQNEAIINEKLNKLKELEDKLRLRQTELNSIDHLISNLNEKEDLLSKSISNYEKEIAAKRTDNQELRKDIDLLNQKKSSIEKILEDLFNSSEQRISRLRETHFKTENEIRDKEIQYEELNQKIDKAIDELVELQKSIHSHKIELEDLNIKSENLKKLNESLEKEIENNNKVLEQFKKMKEEISDGTSEIRKDFSREFGINRDEFNPDSNQKKIFRL